MSNPAGPAAITVAICTYNRSATLEETLSSLLGIRRPKDAAIEVLVVDNNSTDETRLVVERFAARWPGATRYLFEQRQGLSYARNAAIACADAPILAYTDDDVLFHPDWLAALLEAFETHSCAACVGGRAVPVFASGEPGWLTPYLASIYGAVNAGDKPRRLRYPEHPYGLNMAFRRQALRALGGFNTALGRRGTNLLSAEETDLFARADKAGFETMYTPRATVFHRIPASRSTPSWAVRRYYWAGVSHARMHLGLTRPSIRDNLHLAYYELFHLARLIAKRPWTVLRALRGADGESVETLARAAQRVGACREYLAPRGLPRP